MSNGIVYSLGINNIAVTTDENELRRELASQFIGVAKVTRLYFNGPDEVPKTAVRVDFTSPVDARKILREGSVLINGSFRPVYAIKKPAYQSQTQRGSQQTTSTGLPCEEDVVNLFAEQRRRLAETINALDAKLTQAIGVHS